MSFTSRIRSALRPVREDDRAHAYLNEATSLVDLERRQREIDQGLLRRRAYPF
ncbi:DUF3563 family protein [Aureimonas pseudogalii]|jgi:hypothetical protein|uniref:DUF3563 domain-containing protein n=1 Tax=Aureimonas pseudogalii TaxID=1744844 RepID=A0A7W6H7L3_9HYPH|nr:DUF3563 family protein [Aureimonas pseudogalii]MBB4000056.1 hypothetical protein [Aureimonas pseudogalii]